MSTLQATNIKSAASASNNIVLDSSGNATFAGTAAMASSFLRNRLINGGMQIAQRGTSGTSGYLIDRWFGQNTSAISQSSDAPTGFLNSFEFGNSSPTFPFGGQRIERANSFDLAGQTVTLSFWARNVSGTANLVAQLYRANSADNFGSETFEGDIVSVPSLSSSWTRYTGTFTLSASATNGIAVYFVRNNVSAATTRITGVQLEVGTAATPFERRQYGQELALCQRYFSKSFNIETAPASNTGGTGVHSVVCVAASTYTQFDVRHPVTMRASPTVTTYNPGAAGNQARNTDTGVDCSFTGVDSNGQSGFRIATVAPAGSAAGNRIAIHWTSSAEL